MVSGLCERYQHSTGNRCADSRKHELAGEWNDKQRAKCSKRADSHFTQLHTMPLQYGVAAVQNSMVNVSFTEISQNSGLVCTNNAFHSLCHKSKHSLAFPSESMHGRM